MRRNINLYDFVNINNIIDYARKSGNNFYVNRKSYIFMRELKNIFLLSFIFINKFIFLKKYVLL